MRISSKGRYALAAVIEVAHSSDGANVAVAGIAAALGISKIYLEQVFAQLKKAGVLLASKGSRGGYQLCRPPAKITAWEILSALESALTEPAESTVNENAPDIEAALDTLVFAALDTAVVECLSKVTVQDLLDYSERQKAEQSFMLNM